MHKDSHITLPTGQAVQLLRDLDMIVESLSRIAARTQDHADRSARDRLVAEFLEQWEVGRRLAKARDLFAHVLYGRQGDSGREALERELEDVSYWYLGGEAVAATGGSNG